MPTVIRYPQKVKIDEVFSQKTLDMLTSHIFEWQQGPGNIGAIHLHSCWEETSVLKNRYHGQTIASYMYYIQGAMKLYEKTKGLSWKRFADDIASNILYLQSSDGGFRYAAGEFEPAYVPEKTCPIHQGRAVIALLMYAAWEHSNPVLCQMIRPAINRHWEWFNKRFWLIGNAYQKFPMKNPGWCGVTNQDLIIVAALALYAKVYKDSSRFDEYGRLVLETFISDRYYYPEIGLFERGDNENFAERTAYYRIIVYSLYHIYEYTGEKRLLDIIDNVVLHLFDAMYTAEDGHIHLSWGAVTDTSDKSRVLDWVHTPVTFSEYPGIIPCMRSTLERYPDQEKEKKLTELENTLAAYVFADGTIPSALWSREPIISAVATPTGGIAEFWNFMINKLEDKIQEPLLGKTPCIHRSAGNVTWKTKGDIWAIEKDSKNVHAGYKPVSNAVTCGPDEVIPKGNIEDLEQCEIKEIL